MSGLMAWVDIETTGLDENHCELLEVGIMVTTDALEWVDARVVQIKPSEIAMRGLTAWCRSTHTANGLLDLIPSGVDRRQGSMILEAFMDQHFPGDTPPPMCGSSVHFDRKFLAHYMPALEAKFHYRNIDISTVKELVKRWDPEAKPHRAGLSSHRAMPDLNDTVDEARHYMTEIFKVTT